MSKIVVINLPSKYTYVDLEIFYKFIFLLRATKKVI